MTDGEALLKAILAAPDEDTPRLVYADWLQENGQQQRAEFIRVQVWLAGLPEPEYKTIQGVPGDMVTYRHGVCATCRLMKGLCPFHELGRRSNRIVAAHGDSWVPEELRARVMWGWERGFVGVIRGIEADDWLAHADAILAAHPVRRVVLTTWPGGTVGWDAEPEVCADAMVRYDRWPGVAFELPTSAGPANGRYYPPGLLAGHPPGPAVPLPHDAV